MRGEAVLKSLTVINFALLEHACVEFDNGLNILTGETGAGKSILIDALSAALGSRLSVDAIRTDCEFLRIEAVFDITALDNIKVYLESQDILVDEETVIISRKLSQHGKNTILVNGCHITLQTLRQLGNMLIDIHGQHEHQALLRPDSYLTLIDAFEPEIKPLLENYQAMYYEWCETKKQIAAIRENALEHTQRMDMLSWQVQEISTAALKVGEDEELEKEAQLLSNSEKISHAVNKAYMLLEQSGKGTGGTISSLSEVKKELDTAIRFDVKLEEQSNVITDVLYQLKECSSVLRDYLDSFEFNPNRLAKIQDRLDVLDKIKRKYNMTIVELLAYYDTAEQEISAINNHEKILADKLKNLEDIEVILSTAAQKLSDYRQKAATDFSKRVLSHLCDLGMSKAAFFAQWDLCEYTHQGQDSLIFLLSANPGEEPRPLHKVASGGELSRIALAIKAVSSHQDKVGTMIFDEIDSGIGGQTAQMVADKIALVALKKQVICITHSPAIACMADSHIVIEKKLDGKRTHTDIRILNDKERLLEITRMISGNCFSQIAVDNASEIMKNAKKKKEKWKNNA